MLVTTIKLGWQKLDGFFSSGNGSKFTVTVTPLTGAIETFSVMKRAISSSVSNTVEKGGTSGTVTFTEDADVEFELEIWADVSTIGTINTAISATNGRNGTALASFSTNSLGIVTGLDSPRGAIRLDQYQKNKSWRDMEAFIGAPVWALSTAYTNGQVRKHSSNELLICTTAGTSGLTEPALTNNGIITDNTVTWSRLGRQSKVATGLVVPIITNAAIETNIIDRRFAQNPNFYTRNAYFAGGLTPIYVNTAEKVWRFTDVSNAQKANGGYEFYSDAVVISIEGSGGATLIRVYVDLLDGYGYRILEEDITSATTNYRIDWKGSRKMRLYRVVHTLGSGGVGSARLSTSSALDTVTIGDLPSKKRRRAMFFSDSFGRAKTPDISTAPSYWQEEWQLANLLGYQLGCDVTYDQSDAGTGYLQASTTGTIRTHLNLTQVTEVPIDYIIIAAGFNDRSTATNLVAAEALLTWQTARTLYPTAKIIIITAWNDRSASTFATANEAAYLSTFNTWGDNNAVLFRPIFDEPFAVVSGTGYVGATTGNGNSDLYTSTDSTHPTPIGVLHYVDRIATAVRTKLGIEN
jgi:hypothetical protein